MENIVKNEFSEVSYSDTDQKIIQIWAKESKKMCEWEFLEQIDNIFITAEVFNSKVVHIDATDFSYSISKKAVQQINNYLKLSEIKSIEIVLSKNFCGKFQILRLINSISIPTITLTIFQNRQEIRDIIQKKY